MAPTKPTKSKKFSNSAKNNSRSQFKNAVRALGGDEDDVELLRGIESDEDEAVNAKVGGKGQASIV